VPAEDAPVGATPDLYRATRIDYQYSAGDDKWTDPFDAETQGVNEDTRRAQPSPHVTFKDRVLYQSYNYDWLGNTTQTDDDAGGFYDRSLGTVENGTANAGPYQLKHAENSKKGTKDRSGALDARYDHAGNLTRLQVTRHGPCTGSSCNQLFAYEWDEVGRLVKARRWDGTTSSIDDALPTGAAAAHLEYTYDAGDDRVVKEAVDDLSGLSRYTLYLFETLELRRASWLSDSSDYDDSAATEVAYLSAHGVTLGRLWYEPDTSVPTNGAGKLHVFYQLGDALGSTSVVLDQSTSELVERSTFEGYGATESDYRPSRWNAYRSDHRFTGKEEDVEVGLYYFGKRYLNPLLGRWVSADPLAVHGLGADLNVYAYVHGSVLQNLDPLGLGVWSFAKGLASGMAKNVVQAAKGAVKSAKDRVMRTHTAKAVKAAVHGHLAEASAQVALATTTMEAPSPTELYHAAKGAIGAVKEVPKQLKAAVDAGSDRKAGNLAAKPVMTIMVVSATVLGGADAVESLGTSSATESPALVSDADAAGATSQEMEGPAASDSKVGTGCFVAGTLVETIDGPKPIETVKVGDRVLSRNAHATGAVEWRRVIRTLPKPPKRVLRLTLREGSGTTETLGVTTNHPFWRAGKGWTAAGKLQPGNRVWSSQRGWLRVVRAHLQRRLRRVYNLEVDEDHTYTVGRLAAWVHNDRSCPVKPGDTGTYGELKGQKRRFGQTEALDMDHQPSFAAQKEAAERSLGRPLTPAEARQLKNSTSAVASPREVHQQTSPTYGGRNTSARIQQDANDLSGAGARDRAAFDDAMRKR
jgi:RHS repeat-associated protein